MPRPSNRLIYNLSIGLLFAVTIHCAYSIKDLNYYPYGPFWGLDFHNLHTFQNCKFADDPYVVKVNGRVCGDYLNRPIVYPPLYYWSYLWTRGFTHETAYMIFVASITIAMFISLAVFLNLVSQFENENYSHKSRNLIILFWVSLMFTIPFFASIERGNTDPYIVLIWMLSTLFFLQRMFIAWAVILAAAMLYKIYPAIPTAVIGISIISSFIKRESNDYKTLLLIIASGILTMLLIITLWWGQTFTYFTEFFPWYAASKVNIQPFSHAIYHLDLFHPYMPFMAMAVLFVIWCYFSVRNIFIDPLFVFFGCLGISTYFAAVSYVYNSVTLYPLFCLLLLRSRSWIEVSYLTVGVIIFNGNPEIWENFASHEWRVLANVLWLVILIPLYSSSLSFYWHERKSGCVFPPLRYAANME